MWTRLRVFAAGLLRRKAIDAEVDEELRFHVEMERQANIERGMTPVEARRAALRDLGGVAQTMEAVRAVRTLWFDRVLRDLRQAWRGLRRAPGHAAVAIACLSIGLGVCIAAFSAIKALTVGEVPGITNRQQLAVLSLNYKGDGGPGRAIVSSSRFSTCDFETFAHSHGPAFATVAAEGRWIFPVDDGHGRLRPLGGAFVSARYFEALGTRPLRGRLLLEYDDPPSASAVVISENYWREFLGSHEDAVGRTIAIAGHMFTIVGITPRRFVGVRCEITTPGRATIEEPQLWIGLQHASAFTGTPKATEPWHSVVGRLSADYRVSRARHSMGGAAAAIESAHPSIRRHASINVRGHGTDLRDDPAGAVGAVALFMLLPLSVLCVACANVANL